MDQNSVIMEIRAGTGGEEAALFAADLFRMYMRYSEKQGWKTTLLDSSMSSLGGYKEVIFEIKGSDIYNLFKNESGVHRVQRIPKTEKSGRIHTSTASIAVLPEVTEVEFKLNPSELRIDLQRASGPGGQNVNKRETAVRITHLPTGIFVLSRTERNQHQNKEIAMKLLRTRLYEKKQQEEFSARGADRRLQIGSAMRAEKGRTYNYPQNRITDHRIGKSWHNLDAILNGDLNSIIKAFLKNK